MIAWALALALAADDAPPKSPNLEERLREINLEEARHWEMWLDKSHAAKAELMEKPVAVWTNPTTTYGVQHGSVFLWTFEGRPIVIGSIFGHPLGMGKRRLVHEFHAMAPDAISAVCGDEQKSVWEPKAGLTLQPLADSPKPEATAAKRLVQMRTLGREFGGHIIDWRKERWELRLLPQPIYRYEKLPKSVIDGALLALVSNAGTDPEVFLLLEAHEEGWRYALLRFASSDLYVTRNGKEIWSAVRGPEQTQFHNPEYTYQVFHKPIIDDRVDPTEKATP
jgi:hypothetical protein